jgi:hypothetical protein
MIEPLMVTTGAGSSKPDFKVLRLSTIPRFYPVPPGSFDCGEYAFAQDLKSDTLQ